MNESNNKNAERENETKAEMIGKDDAAETKQAEPSVSKTHTGRETLSDTIPTSEVGLISKNTKIIGDVITTGHLDIEGIVEGNIEAVGNIRVSGKITGDVKCGSFLLNDGALKTNITAREDVSLGENSQIEGVIRCKNITACGVITGNINASENVSIAGTAVINGDITAKGLAVGIGAVINGNIKMGK